MMFGWLDPNCIIKIMVFYQSSGFLTFAYFKILSFFLFFKEQPERDIDRISKFNPNIVRWQNFNEFLILNLEILSLTLFFTEKLKETEQNFFSSSFLLYVSKKIVYNIVLANYIVRKFCLQMHRLYSLI